MWGDPVYTGIRAALKHHRTEPFNVGALFGLFLCVMMIKNNLYENNNNNLTALITILLHKIPPFFFYGLLPFSGLPDPTLCILPAHTESPSASPACHFRPQPSSTDVLTGSSLKRPARTKWDWFVPLLNSKERIDISPAASSVASCIFPQCRFHVRKWSQANVNDTFSFPRCYAFIFACCFMCLRACCHWQRLHCCWHSAKNGWKGKWLVTFILPPNKNNWDSGNEFNIYFVKVDVKCVVLSHIVCHTSVSLHM